MIKCIADICGFYDETCEENCNGSPFLCSFYKNLKGNKEPVAKLQIQRGVISPERIKEQLDKLLNKVNAVTCPYRHGQKVTDRVLTELSNRQLDVEEALREMGL